MKRHFAFAVAFCTGDISTTEAAAATDTNAFGTEFHGSLNGALHGAAECDPALKLNRDLLCNKLRIELWLADFENIEFHLGLFADFLHFVGHDLDFLTLATDDETGTGGVESDADAVPSTLDYDAGEACVDKLVFEVCADSEIFVKLVGIVLAGGIPFGTPVFVDSEAEGDRIYFLTHGVKWRVLEKGGLGGGFLCGRFFGGRLVGILGGCFLFRSALFLFRRGTYEGDGNV